MPPNRGLSRGQRAVAVSSRPDPVRLPVSDHLADRPPVWLAGARVGPCVVLAVIGPPRDQWSMRRSPEWGSYAPGIARVLAISASDVILFRSAV